MEKSIPNQQQNLVLASSSESRKKQLLRLGVPFQAQAPEIDETPLIGEDAETLVHRLSIEKAFAVAASFPNSLVISGDQTASFAGKFLNKPGTRVNAVEQLWSLQGRRVDFISGLCVLDTATGQANYRVAHCDVKFRQLTRQQIETYIDMDEPFFCAGSFKCEAAGIGLFEYMKSDDPSAITGMPLIALVSLLEAVGYKLFNGS